MKKLFLLLLFVAVGTIRSFAYNDEDISKYRLKEYATFEEFKEHYLNQVITYSPVKTKIFGSESLIQQMNLDFKMRDFKVTSITLEKKKKDYITMSWSIKEVNGVASRTFTVHAGNYTKRIPYSSSDRELMFQKLQFFQFGKFRQDHQSEIGITYTDPMVKAQYEVVDVYLDIQKDPIGYKDKIFKMYKVKNSDSGKTKGYIAEAAKDECFKEDKAGYYVSTLAKVEKPSNPSVKYGKTTTVEDKGITKYSYEDNYISIVIFGGSERFNFTLKNVSQSTQRLVWDEAVFVDITGSTSKVMHNGIKYSQREAPQPASTIIKGASLDDLACPTGNVYYSDVLKEWRVKSMYPTTVSKETYHVQLMLPIQIKDVTNEYIFIFDINYKYKYPERLNL